MTNYTLIVAGTFDAKGGKPSGYMKKLGESFQKGIKGPCTFLNGGDLTTLDMGFQLSKYATTVLWFANVANSDPVKRVHHIKVKNPHALLVISKNNKDGKYQYMDLLGRLFTAHANYSLIIEPMEPTEGTTIRTTLIDPLGNAYFQYNTDPEYAGKVLAEQVTRHLTLTRVKSVQIDKQHRQPEMNDELKEFFGLVKGYASKFHEMVHGANTSRFLGNCSSRCTKGGFPSFRQKELVFVSKRDLDKREISVDNFVAVDAFKFNPVEYFGVVKPSVDTPIQVQLYAILPNVQFMLHSHCYIEGAPFTRNVLPCGAIEEFREIIAALGNKSEGYVNIRGHGSIVLANSVALMRDIPYIARPFLELVN